MTNDKPRYYILVGKRRIWKEAFNKKLWGFTDKTKGSWNTTKKGDFVVFYVTKPLMKIIGFGIITKKFSSDEYVFPDEKLFEKIIWKYKIKFKIIHIEKEWENGIDVPKKIILNSGRKVVDKKMFSQLARTAEKKWNIQLDELNFN